MLTGVPGFFSRILIFSILTGMAGQAIAQNWNLSSKGYEDFPEHEFARSPLRSLEIPDDYVFFLTAEDLEAFRQSFAEPVHERHPIRWWKMSDYVADCTRALAEFDTSWLKHDLPARLIRCKTVLTHAHYRDPESGIAPIEQILLAWAENAPVIYRSNSSRWADDQAYAATMTLSDFASFYAVYYDQFRFDEPQRRRVETYLSDWIINHDLDPDPGLTRCPLETPAAFTRSGDSFKIDTDYCGSNRWRIGIAGVYLGLRLKDQKLFEAGNRHVEINLATIDEDGIFPHWARKGALALSYQRQLPEVLTLLATAYESLGYDFYEHRLPHGKRIHEVYATLFDFIHHPEKLNKYAAAAWNFVGENLWEFDKLPLEEKWRREMIYPDVLVPQSTDYVLRYRPDLAELLDYEAGWEGRWKEHIGVFVSISGITVYEAAHGYATKREAREKQRQMALAQEIARNKARFAENARRIKEQERQRQQAEKLAFAQEVARNKARLAENARRIKEQEQQRQQAAILGFEQIRAMARYEQVNGRYVLPFPRLVFAASNPPRQRETGGHDERVKAQVTGTLSFESSPESDGIIAAAQQIAHFQRFGALVSLFEDPRGNRYIGILAGDLNPPFDVTARITDARSACGRTRKPNDWLVFPSSTTERADIEQMDCFREIFHAAGEDQALFFDTLLLAVPAIDSLLQTVGD